MKKFILGFILLFLLTLNVEAETLKIYDLEKGDIYSNEDRLNSATNTYETATTDLIHVIYVNKEGNILEAFTATSGGEFTYIDYNNLYDYPVDMYLHKSVEFNFGNTCQKTYSQFSEEHVEWCDNHLNMYSSGKDISNIKYWKVESFEEIRLSEICATTPEVQGSFSCTDGLDPNKMSYEWWIEENPKSLYDSYPVLILKEYAPAEFKLECDPKEVKKGETSNCQLKVNTEEKISEITINKDLSNEPFTLKEITPTEGWEIIENKTDTITLINNNGFEEEGTIFNTIIQFKEDFVDTANIELNNIDYMTSNGYELKGSAKDDIKVYEEIKNPETKNPFTGILCLLGIIILTNVFMYYKSRKNRESELI